MINAFAMAYDRSSFAVHARGFFGALHRRHPVAWFPFDRPSLRREVLPDAATPEMAEMLANARGGVVPGPGIGVGDIASAPRIRGTVRAAFVVWEPTLLPPEKRACLREVDRILTPTEWGRALLVANGFAADRVAVVPEGVDVARFCPDGAAGGRAGQPFRFLCVARWTLRKGVAEVVAAFCREFRAGEPVELVLHCEGQADAKLRRLLHDLGVVKHAPITTSGWRTEAEMAALYNGCGALVLATRAEGWGLPVAEAMACALPVIATHYSAVAEVLHEGIGYPLRVERMIDVHDPVRFPGPGPYGQWAQPDVEHLCALMRHVYEHPDEAREKGRRAREEVSARWTWERAAAAACAALEVP
jgi:glycosyltransferase involved in cell wall biosynthesis